MVARNTTPTSSYSENCDVESSIQLEEQREDCENEEDRRDQQLSSLMKGFFSQVELRPQTSFADLATKHECRWAQEQFILVDKEEETLPPTQEKLFKEHLQSCFNCSEELETSKQVRKLVSFPEIESTRSLESFWQKVRCDEFQLDFVALLQYEISSEREKEIQSHLSTCTLCNTTFQQVQKNLKQTASLLMQQEIEPSPVGWESLKKKFVEEQTLSSSEKNTVSYSRYAVSFLFLTAALVLVATLVWNKFQQTPPRLVSGHLLTANHSAILYGTPLQTSHLVAALEMDGIQILANKETRFTLNSSSSIFLEQGELLIQVPKGKGYSLTVKTPNADALVLGTKFHIQAQKTQTDLAVLEGKVAFASKQQKIQATFGTEALVNSAGQVKIVRQISQDTEALRNMEQEIFKKYQKNALSLLLEKGHQTTFRFSFTNHGRSPLEVVPIKPNTPSYSWTISGPQGKIQIPASPTLNRNSPIEKNLLIQPGQTISILYDVSPYLTVPGEYELSLNYLVNEQPQSHFWTGHLQSNKIRLNHSHH